MDHTIFNLVETPVNVLKVFVPLNLIELALLKTILAVNNNVYTKLKNVMHILFQ